MYAMCWLLGATTQGNLREHRQFSRFGRVKNLMGLDIFRPEAGYKAIFFNLARIVFLM
jgi:hypothetical protein